MGAVARELLRRSQERIIAYERELDALGPGDPPWRRDELEKALREERAILVDRERDARDNPG